MRLGCRERLRRWVGSLIGLPCTLWVDPTGPRLHTREGPLIKQNWDYFVNICLPLETSGDEGCQQRGKHNVINMITMGMEGAWQGWGGAKAERHEARTPGTGGERRAACTAAMWSKLLGLMLVTAKVGSLGVQQGGRAGIAEWGLVNNLWHSALQQTFLSWFLLLKIFALSGNKVCIEQRPVNMSAVYYLWKLQVKCSQLNKTSSIALVYRVVTWINKYWFIIQIITPREHSWEE